MALSDGRSPGDAAPRAVPRREFGGDDKRVFLFDIDGTLLKCGPQIRAIFGDALRSVFGTTGPLDSYDFAGKTDHGIVWDLMRRAELADERIAELFPVFRHHYIESLEQRLDGDAMRLMPGLPEVLERLEMRDDVVLGLLTGNFRRGASIKLSRLGLEGFFAFGAFGDDVGSRLDLPPVALSEASAALGGPISPERAVIIGDSVLDVACARAHGIECVAVTTGFVGRDELVSAGAKRVADTLLEAEQRYFSTTSRLGPDDGVG